MCSDEIILVNKPLGDLSIGLSTLSLVWSGFGSRMGHTHRSLRTRDKTGHIF